MSDLIYKFAHFIFTLFFKIFYRWEVKGKENIPSEGRIVVMANHISYLDPPIMGCALNRKVHFMAKEELFKIPVFGYLLRLIGQFPVKRGKPDRAALKQSIKVLEEEKVLGIFPEGTTKGKKHIRKAKSGAILIPIVAKSPILPIGIKFVNRRIKVSIGKIFALEEYYDRKLNKEERNTAGEIIMNKISEEIDKL